MTMTAWRVCLTFALFLLLLCYGGSLRLDAVQAQRLVDLEPCIYYSGACVKPRYLANASGLRMLP